MHDPLLADFPHSLQSIVLCGARGLPAAWGPLARPLDGVWTWNPLTQRAIRPATIEQPAVLAQPDGWTLPLEHWRPRLALVAACLLMPRHSYLCAHIEAGTRFIALTRVRFTEHERGMAIGDWTWDVGSGRTENARIDLPTLPAHLLTHDPACALLLALFDVPEIRAKVEALNG